ncbi:hypothetical protein SLS62_006616 [Diatrype stigma]|uniref:Glycoside hydrolase family 43 protein n=1 Tax=Diatrype stigma TaxID=117547 RepID=A0AAN9US83_9PEZI
MNISFPDPSIVKDGDAWKAYATSSNNAHIPVAESSDAVSWTFTGKDALPDVGFWVDPKDRGIWAPDVFQNDDGDFVMYYSGKLNGGGRCIGVATSANSDGPFTPLEQPLICDKENGGAIDAAGFDDGEYRWIMWKVDGNALGGATTCTGGEKSDEYKPTPIKIQKVSRDGLTLQGSAKVIFDNNGKGDDGVVEGPSMYKVRPGSYVLFFSTHCYSSDSYDIQYAWADAPDAQFGSRGVLAQSNADEPIYGPGHMDIDTDGSHIVFHGRTSPGNPSGTKRYMFSGIIGFE